MPFTPKRARASLWLVRGLLAALFLFAGGFNLLPAAFPLVATLAVTVAWGRRDAVRLATARPGR